jgi:hypothetical protein
MQPKFHVFDYNTLSTTSSLSRPELNYLKLLIIAVTICDASRSRNEWLVFAGDHILGSFQTKMWA